VICPTYIIVSFKKALLINVCMFIKATKKRLSKKRKVKQIGGGQAPWQKS